MSLGKDNSISCPVKLFLCFRPSVDKVTDELKLLDLALDPSLAFVSLPLPLLFGTGNEAINYRMAVAFEEHFSKIVGENADC